MTYTIKGKLKKFLELNLIGKSKIAEEIAEALNSLYPNETRFSRRNHAYAIELVTNGYNNLPEYYVLWRDGKKVMRYGITKDGNFSSDIQKTDIERLYRTWKELR